jgi:hypothetical protein
MQTECLTRLSLSVTTCTCEVIQDTLETQDKAKLGTIARELQGIQKLTEGDELERGRSKRIDTSGDDAGGGRGRLIAER